MSLIGNLVLYLHTMYNLDNVASAYVFQIWGGTTNFAPLAGAFLADAYLGRFYTLLFGSVASLLVLFYHIVFYYMLFVSDFKIIRF